MKTRINGTCEMCGKDLTGMAFEETNTKHGHDFCSYVCMEAFYGDNVPEDEDFIIVPS